MFRPSMFRSWAFVAAAAAAATAIAGPGAGPIPAPGPIPVPRAVCYQFNTIAIGQYSGFGYYCGAPLNDPSPDPSTDPAPPCYTAVAQPEFEAVIRGECAWIDFWTAHTSNIFPPPPVPDVDFDRFVVIALVAGPRPDGCRGIEVTQIVNDGCGTKVLMRERVPCPGEACTDAITNPFHFVKVCKQFVPFERPVCFEHRRIHVPCVLTAACITDTDPAEPAGP